MLVSISADRLAIEIWLSIFRWATFVPEALRTDVPDPFSYPAPCTQEEIQKKIVTSLRTRWALALVCKRWRELSAPFLYETLYIGSDMTLKNLSRILSPPDSGDEDGRRSYEYATRAIKKWTKRIDFAIRDREKHNESSFRMACHLTNFAHNLEIVVVRKGRMCGFWSPNSQDSSASSSKQLTASENMMNDRATTWRTLPKVLGVSDEWGRKDDTEYWRVELTRFIHLRWLEAGMRNPYRCEISALSPPLPFPSLQGLHITSFSPIPFDVSDRDTEKTFTVTPFYLTYEGDDVRSIKNFFSYSPGITFSDGDIRMDHGLPSQNTIRI